MKRVVPAVLVALGLAACGGGGSSGLSPGLVGVAFDDTGAPARGQPVALDPPGGPITQVGADGRFFLVPVNQGSHVLKIGDSKTVPTIVVAAATSQAAFLPRPIFLPLLESGVATSVPPVTAAALTIQGPNLPGVSLALGPSTAVAYPTGAPQAITIVAIAPSRLPVALPNGLTAKAAWCVEPRGTTFTPGATLTLPQLENSASGWDLWKLDDTATWKLFAAIAPAASQSLVARIDAGSLYAAVPRTPSATVTVTGRVVSGARPIAGYRVDCWNQVSGPTGADGRFTIANVPTSFGGFPLHAFPDQPGLGFAPEVTFQVVTLNGNDTGDVAVNAQAPITVPPKVLSTRPPDGATNVALQTQVSVQFSNAVDPRNLALSLKGTNGPVAGQLFLSNAFTAVFVPAQSLQPAQKYSIVVDPNTTDLAGNFVDTSQLVFGFTTQNVTPPPPPADQKVFGFTPTTGTASTLVTMSGRNFPGGSAVTVGAKSALVNLETATQIQFFPPTFEPAANAPVAVINSANTTVTSLGPLVFDLRSSVSSLSSASILRSAPPAALFVTGTGTSNGTAVFDGNAIASINSTEVFGGLLSVTGQQVTLAPGLAGIFTGPVLVRRADGKPGLTYRFLLVSDR